MQCIRIPFTGYGVALQQQVLITSAGAHAHQQIKTLPGVLFNSGPAKDLANVGILSGPDSEYRKLSQVPGARITHIDTGLLPVYKSVQPLGTAFNLNEPRLFPDGALARAFAKIFKGTHTELDEGWTRQVRRIEFIDPSRQPVLIDGDLFHLTPHAVDVLPSALRLVA